MKAFVHRADLLVDEANADLVVFDPKSGLAHVLNETAALVFLLCDGRPPREIARELEVIPGAPGHDVEAEVAALLEALASRELLFST